MIPATPSSALNFGQADTAENTPGLFVTPRTAVANVKRKNDQRSSSNSAKLHMPVLKRQETVELYTESRINFDDNIGSEGPQASLEATVVSSVASIREERVSTTMFATRDEHLAFLPESPVARRSGAVDDEGGRKGFNIVDVANSKADFTRFLNQCYAQERFSFSLACEAYQQEPEPVMRIGPQRLAVAGAAEKKVRANSHKIRKYLEARQADPIRLFPQAAHVLGAVG